MEPPFDRAKALQQVDGDEDFLAEVVDAFLKECPAMHDEIVNAIGKTDAVALRRSAHTLKGSADILAATPTRLAALALEDLARAGQWSGVAKIAATVEIELGRLQEALRDYASSR